MIFNCKKTNNTIVKTNQLSILSLGYSYSLSQSSYWLGGLKVWFLVFFEESKKRITRNLKRFLFLFSKTFRSMAKQVYARDSKSRSERSESSILSRPTFMHLKCLWLHAGPPNRNRGVQLSLGARFYVLGQCWNWYTSGS